MSIERFFLSETYPPVEHAAHGVPHATTRQTPEALTAWRARKATCAHCKQTIASPRLVTRGGKTYHPSCAERAAPQRRTTGASKALAVIAVLEGAAVSFDPAGCAIPQRDGSMQHERFAPGCFDASLAAGGQQLMVNHTGAPVRGTFSRIWHDAGDLKFRFRLHDGERERALLKDVKAGRFAGCSVGFKSETQRYRGTMVEYEKARLLEISLCTAGKKPAWFGTGVQAVEVK